MSHSLAELLEHAAWVRRLAARLVQDPDVADDVAQTAFVRAMERPPGDVKNPRAWWAKVVRNVVINLSRSEGRRRNRESMRAEDDARAESEAVVERMDLQQELAQVVLGLREPYRTVVLLRHYEELSPRQVAARLGETVGAVNTRLHRAHAQLREKLDEKHGSRKAWAVAWMPLLDSSKKSLGAAAFTAFAAASVLGATAFLYHEPDPVAGDEVIAAPEPEDEEIVEAEVLPVDESEVDPQTEQRTAVVDLHPFRATVYDERGNTLGHFSVMVDGVEFETDELGRLDAEAVNRRPRLTTEEEEWSLLTTQLIDGTQDRAIVACPPRTVTGTMKNPDGVPIKGARIVTRFQGAPQFFPLPLEDRNDRLVALPETVTDEFGRFRFDAAPDDPALSFDAPEISRAKRFRLPGGDQLGIEWVVGESEDISITGHVYDPEGQPLSGITVRLVNEKAVTNERGAYALSLPNESYMDSAMTAIEDFYWVGIEPNVVSRVRAEPDKTHVIDLKVAEAGRLQFQMKDATGALISGFKVQPAETEGYPFIALSYLANNLQVNANTVLVDNLLDQEYRFEFITPTGASVTAGPFKPQIGWDDGLPEPIVIEMPQDLTNARFKGRVVDQFGQPVPNAAVRLGSGPNAKTGTDGTFELQGTPAEGARLSVKAPNHLDLYERLDSSLEEGADIELLRYGRCKFADGLIRKGDLLTFYDDDERAYPVRWGNTRASAIRWEFEESPIFTVPLHVTRIRFFAQDRVIDVELSRDGVTVIQ